MPLTKKDLIQIKGLVHDELENLARIVAKGFEMVDKRFEQVDKRFEQVDKRFEQVDKRLDMVDDRLLHIDARLNTIEHDMADIRKHFVYRDEFEDALNRLAVIEKKLSIRSRKYPSLI